MTRMDERTHTVGTLMHNTGRPATCNNTALLDALGITCSGDAPGSWYAVRLLGECVPWVGLGMGMDGKLRIGLNHGERMRDCGGERESWRWDRRKGGRDGEVDDVGLGWSRDK
jgi:hypothetical protein